MLRRKTLKKFEPALRRFLESQKGQGSQWAIVASVFVLVMGVILFKEFGMDGSATGLISLAVWLLLGCLVFGLAVWVVGVMELEKPNRQIVLAVVGVIAIAVILYKMGVIPL